MNINSLEMKNDSVCEVVTHH